MSTPLKFSASKSHIWINCAASAGFSKEKKLGKINNENRIAGIRAHFLLELAIRTNTHPEHMLSGIKYTDTHGIWIPTKEMIEAVEFTYAYVLLRTHEINAVAVCEETVDPSAFISGIHGEIGCVCDIYIKSHNYLEVIDFKYGMTEVQIVDNSQLELSAAGVIHKYVHKAFKPATVQLTILQPRINILGQLQIKTMVTPYEALKKRWTIIAESVSLAKTDEPTFNAGQWCKHCSALGECSANNEQSLKVLGYNPLDVVDQAMEHVDVKTVPDEQLVEIFTASKQIKQMLIACQDELTLRAHNKSIKGVKLVTGKGSKSWSVDNETLHPALASLGAPAEAWYVTKTVSPAQALNVTWGLDNKVGRLNKVQKDRLTELITINKGKPTLVFQNDSREAIGVEVGKLFNKKSGVIAGWTL